MQIRKIQYLRSMKVVNGFNVYTHEEMLDRVIGKKGTTSRDKFEAKKQRAIKRKKNVQSI